MSRPAESALAGSGDRAGDLALARSASGGDDAAVEEFVRTTQGPVWRFCRHLLDNDDDAYDATQDTYLRALTALGSYRGDSALLTWLLTIARRVCGKQIRDRVKVRSHETAGVEAMQSGGDVSLGMVLDGLPLDLREALVLTQVVGLSYEEAAQAVGCPVGTIRSRVFRARQRLIEARG